MDPSSYRNAFASHRSRLERPFFSAMNKLNRTVKESENKDQEWVQSNWAQNDMEEETSKIWQQWNNEQNPKPDEMEEETSRIWQQWNQQWNNEYKTGEPPKPWKKTAEPPKQWEPKAVQEQQREPSPLSTFLKAFAREIAIELTAQIITSCIEHYLLGDQGPTHRSDRRGGFHKSGSGSHKSGEKPPEDLYALLGVSPSATQKEVQKAARMKRIETHPDKCGGANLSRAQYEGVLERSKIVGQAADILCDPVARQKSDSALNMWNRREKAAGRPQSTWASSPSRDASSSEPVRDNGGKFSDWLARCISSADEIISSAFENK